MMRTRAAAVTAVTVLAGAGLTAAIAVTASAPASAAAAGRPVVVSSTASTGHTKNFFLQAAGSKWVLLTVQGRSYAEPVGGGGLVRLPDASQDYPMTVNGDMAFYHSASSKRNDYYDLATRTFAVANASWSAVSPHGGVYSGIAKTDGKMHGYEQDAATGVVTDLGVLTGFGDSSYASALTDESGAVFFQSYGGGHNRASYVAFAHPGTVTPLQTHDQGDITCESLTSNALGCATSGDTIYRVPLDGSAARTTTITFPKHAKASGAYSRVFVTAARTYWVLAYDEYGNGSGGQEPAAPIHSVPADEPHATPAATSFVVPLVDYTGVAAGGGKLFFAYGYSAGKGGIYRVSGDHEHRIAYHLVDAEHELGTGLALGTGQALFDDNSNNGFQRLRARLFTRSGSTVEPGRIVDISTFVNSYEPVVPSASRVLYDGSKRITISSVVGSGKAHGTTSFDDNFYSAVTLSGTRAIVSHSVRKHGHYTRHLLLVNLVTGSHTDLGATYGVRGAPALFGNYLAYGTKNGSIRRLSLATKKSVLVAGPTAASRGKTPHRVVEWGNYVAWDYATGKNTYSSYFRNARSMSPRVALPGHDVVVGASADGVTLHPAGVRVTPTLVRPWTSGAGTRTVYPRKAFVASSTAAYTVDAHSNDLGGTMYAKPLTHAPDRPRSLGNPFAAATVQHGHTWHYDLPTSAALTSCTVGIRRHGHTVRTLSCGTTLMHLGEISASWNGRTMAGHQAARGRYQVVVTARNADGTLLSATGSHTRVDTTVTVR